MHSLTNQEIDAIAEVLEALAPDPDDATPGERAQINLAMNAIARCRMERRAADLFAFAQSVVDLAESGKYGTPSLIARGYEACGMPWLGEQYLKAKAVVNAARGIREALDSETIDRRTEALNWPTSSKGDAA